MITVIRYTSNKAELWDAFVRSSRNGTFLFLRGYMDYHSDRFSDHSLMYYDGKGRLAAIMPANEKDGILYSHQGLTYGGIVLGDRTHAVEVGEILEKTAGYLRSRGIREWHYKAVPSIYQKYPSQEDEYWLWRMGAEQETCNLACVIDLRQDDDTLRGLSNTRKLTYRNKLQHKGYTMDFGASLSEFWAILEENLRITYDAKPVHTLSEIQRLQDKFPKNIVCVMARNAEGTAEAGVLLFITGNVVKTQYISASQEGKRTKALDFLMLSLIEHFRTSGDFRYLDLGTSNGDGGRYLNEGLILQKEGFGGRGVAYKLFSCLVV